MINIMDSFRIGEKAEAIVADWMIQQGWVLKDVRKDKVYQIKDIDYLIIDGNYQTAVDVKSDKCFNTGNYFIETFSNIEKNKIGWGFGSEADYIFVYYPTAGELHIIDMHILKPWLIKNAGKYRTITNGSERYNGSTYRSQGIVIDRDKLAQEIGIENIMVYQLSDVKDVA